MTAIHMDINPNSIRAALAGIGNRAPQKTLLDHIIGERAANAVASMGAHVDNGGTMVSWLKKEAPSLAGGYMLAKTGECASKAVDRSNAADRKALKGLGDFTCKFFTGRDMAGLGRFITGR